MERIDPRARARASDLAPGQRAVREYLDRYARLLEREPSTPQSVRDRIGVLIRRVADPEPVILRVVPEVAAAVVAAAVTAVLVTLMWLEPTPLPLFVAFAVTFLIAHFAAVPLYRRWIYRRRDNAIRALDALLGS